MADDIVGAVQAQDGGKLLLPVERGLRDEQEGTGSSARLGGVCDLAADVIASVKFLLDLHIERAAFLRAGKCSHDFLHPAQDFRAALLPVFARLHAMHGVVVAVKCEEVVAIKALRLC